MRKEIISFLVLLLIAPLNASAASWMAMSMSDSEHHVEQSAKEALPHGANHGQHMAGAHIDAHEESQSAEQHEHDATDCEEHCSSCTNHCSSTGIVTSTMGFIDAERDIAGVISGTPSSRFELLFRPPISS